MLQVIKFGSQTTVEPVPVDPDGRASLILDGFGDTLERAILIIAGATPVTTEVTYYEVSVEPAP